MQGIFITFEGPDGAGKTSVLKEVSERLAKESKRKIVTTREPGGIPIAEKIRTVILDPRNDRMDERTEALLYAAARRQHLVEKILPALEAGHLVLCDRFVDSSLAYQGAGRRIGIAPIASINAFATEGVSPDFTIYLDVDSDTGLRRIQENRLDSEGLEFHQRVRHEYLKLAEENPQRIKKIDARMSLELVVEATYQAIIGRYPENF